MSNIKRLIQPGSIEDVLNRVSELNPKALLIFVQNQDDEVDVLWNGLSLTEIAYALRCIGIRLDQHIKGEITEWL